jgi:cysteine desulfurase/selenocysteine lyase
VPWQMLCEKTGATKVIPMNENWSWPNTINLSENTKIVTNHISNALGTINPIKYMIDKAHAVSAAV